MGFDISVLFSPQNLMFLLLGTTVGIIFGVLPGLGGPQVLAVLMPLTFAMEPFTAMLILIGAMAAIPVSGSITAILINTPGSGQNVATTIDGYAMTKVGLSGEALGASATASALGGLFGAMVLIAILPFGRQMVLAFSYPEYFMMGIIAFMTIAFVATGSAVKSLISACFGLAITTIGFDPVSGVIRFSFGSVYLWDGIKLIPSVVGLFAVSEAISLFRGQESISKHERSEKVPGFGSVFKGIKSVFANFSLFIRCSIIGTLVGIIPGVGAGVATWMAYGHAVQTSKDSKNFGKGDIRGVIAPEASNNAKDGGSLVPTLIFGIPGSIETAVFLGALMIFGLVPGPRLMIEHPIVIYAIIIALVLGNLISGAIALLIANPLSRITEIKGSMLAPVILTIALLSAFVVNYEYWDVVVALVFGIIGYYMKEYKYSHVPLTIALVLGELLQNSFAQTKKVFGLGGFIYRPISLIILLIIVSIFIIRLIKILQERKNTKKEKDTGFGTYRTKIDNMSQRSELIITSLFLAFFIIFAFLSTGYPSMPRQFPLLVGCTGIGLTIARLGWLLKHRNELQVLKQNWLPVLTFCLCALMYVIMLRVVSVWVIIPLFLLLFIRFMSKESWIKSIIVSTTMWGFLFVLFRLFLKATF